MKNGKKMLFIKFLFHTFRTFAEGKTLGNFHNLKKCQLIKMRLKGGGGGIATVFSCYSLRIPKLKVVGNQN